MYRPSQRPSFRFRMFPSPFARLFGIKSASFANEQYRSQEGKATRKRNSYQKVIICPSEPRRRIFVYGGAIFALLEAFFFGYSGAIFERSRSPFIDYSGAKYTRFPPKIAAIRNHFFEWLKTANFSTACGTVTLKSPLSRAFSTPHVHPRLRRRISRCTLDCGFKTPESPALRGFVGERCPIRGTSLYLVLKSNGFHRSENCSEKFVFLSKKHLSNIAQKLSSQTHLKSFLTSPFNFSRKRLTFAFTPESGYTLGFSGKIAHSGSHTETWGTTLASVRGHFIHPPSTPEKSRRKRMHAELRFSISYR